MSVLRTLKTRILLSLLTVLVIPAMSEAKVDREAYATSVYNALETILPILLEDGSIKDPDAKDFLDTISNIRSAFRPDLIFVDDPEQFVMQPGEKPVLMRAPDQKSSPIYVNRTLLNSDGYSLNLVQLMKLFIHELGHKSRMSNIAERDQWAQQIERRLASFYLSSGSQTSSEPDENFVEAFSFPPEMIQFPIVLDTYQIQPTAWVYLQREGRVSEVTAPLLSQTAEKSLLTRNIGTEIIMVITEVANAMSELTKQVLEPLAMISNSFREPGTSMQTVDDILPLPKNLKALSLLNLRKISQSSDEIIIEATQNYVRSHMKKMKFNIQGFPWNQDGESYPIVIKIGKEMTASSPKINVQISAEPNYGKLAKVGRITRNDGRLTAMELTFENASFPFSVDLTAHYTGGSFRITAKERELKKDKTYRITYDFSASETQLASYVDRITVDNEEVIFLDRKIEIQDVSYAPPAFQDGDVMADSIGVWGQRGGEDELKKEFSHLLHPILFFLSGPGTTQYVINPYNLWIQFEVREEIEISQAELIWSASYAIAKIDPNDTGPVINMTERTEQGDVEQRFIGQGSMVETTTLREMIMFDRQVLRESRGSRPGYKTIRMRSFTPLKHPRVLKAGEGYMMPSVTPIGLRILDRDLRSYDHSFPSDPLTSGSNMPKFAMNCADLLKPARKPQ